MVRACTFCGGLIRRAIDAWLESPSLVLLDEDEGCWPALRSGVVDGGVTGPLVHDPDRGAVPRTWQELWTQDRDFGRFPALRTRNPLV